MHYLKIECHLYTGSFMGIVKRIIKLSIINRKSHKVLLAIWCQSLIDYMKSLRSYVILNKIAAAAPFSTAQWQLWPSLQQDHFQNLYVYSTLSKQDFCPRSSDTFMPFIDQKISTMLTLYVLISTMSDTVCFNIHNVDTVF